MPARTYEQRAAERIVMAHPVSLHARPISRRIVRGPTGNPPARAVEARGFNPSQPRDYHGRWSLVGFVSHLLGAVGEARVWYDPDEPAIEIAVGSAEHLHDWDRHITTPWQIRAPGGYGGHDDQSREVDFLDDDITDLQDSLDKAADAAAAGRRYHKEHYGSDHGLLFVDSDGAAVSVSNRHLHEPEQFEDEAEEQLTEEAWQAHWATHPPSDEEDDWEPTVTDAQITARAKVLLAQAVHPSTTLTPEQVRQLAQMLTQRAEPGKEVRAAAKFNPALHPHDPNTGRWRNTLDRVLDGLRRWAASGDKGDPFDWLDRRGEGFSREQLRRLGTQRGLSFPPRTSEKKIRDDLLDNLRDALAGEGPVKKAPTKAPGVDSFDGRPRSAWMTDARKAGITVPRGVPAHEVARLVGEHHARRAASDSYALRFGGRDNKPGEPTYDMVSGKTIAVPTREEYIDAVMARERARHNAKLAALGLAPFDSGEPSPKKAQPSAPKAAPEPPSRLDLAKLRSLDDPEAIRDALDLHKVPELKEALREQKLPLSGRKRELVDRLVEHLAAGKADGRPAEVAKKAAPKRKFSKVPPLADEVEQRARQRQVRTLLREPDATDADWLRGKAQDFDDDSRRFAAIGDEKNAATYAAIAADLREVAERKPPRATESPSDVVGRMRDEMFPDTPENADVRQLLTSTQDRVSEGRASRVSPERAAADLRNGSGGYDDDTRRKLLEIANALTLSASYRSKKDDRPFPRSGEQVTPDQARARFAEIDAKRKVADMLTEALGLVHNEADQDVARRRITALALANGVDDATRDALLTDVGDHAKLTETTQRLARDAGLTPVAQPGQVVPFDRKLHESIYGSPQPGEKVGVEEASYTLRLSNGETVALSKAKVSTYDPTIHGPAPEAREPSAPPVGRTEVQLMWSMDDRHVELRPFSPDHDATGIGVASTAPLKGKRRPSRTGRTGQVTYQVPDGVYEAKDRFGHRYLIVEGGTAREASYEQASTYDPKLHGPVEAPRDALAAARPKREPTEAEMAALRRYGGDGGYVINSDLRATGGQTERLTPRNRATVEALDALMVDSPLPREVVVHRKLSLARNPFGTSTTGEVDPLDRDLAGFSWTEPAYSSTSVGTGQLRNREISLRITAPAGTPALSHAEFDNDEIVLPRGLTFRVTADHGKDGRLVRHLDVEIVPATPEVAKTPRKRAPKATAPAGRVPAAPVVARDLFTADDATIETALRDVFEGQFGPYTTKATVKVIRAGTRTDKRGREHKIEPSVSVEGKIYDADGTEIGYFGRSISPVEMHYADGIVRREVWANHSIVQLGGGDYDENPTKYHGTGFGGEFNRRAIEWYRASGVHGIGQSDHNGYVWASQGFNFGQGGKVPDYLAEDIRTLIADLRAGKATSQATKDEYHSIPKRFRDAPDLQSQIAQAEALLARIASTKPGEPGYPTAYEISQLGRRKGQHGKTALWLGKLLFVSADELILNPDEGEVISS